MHIAGAVLEIGGAATEGGGAALALKVLQDGRAWRKFQRICAAQGGMRDPPRAGFIQPLRAARSGFVTLIDNRRLSRLAKLCGAPGSPAAGVRIEVRLGEEVRAGQPLLHLHAQTPGELAYAVDYARSAGSILLIES